MKVVLRNPRREVEIAGGRRVKEILRDLDILPETVLVIRGDDLVTADQIVHDDDTIELRPVMSGGSSDILPHGRENGLRSSLEAGTCGRNGAATHPSQPTHAVPPTPRPPLQ